MSRVLPPVRLHSSDLLRLLVAKGLADNTLAAGDVGMRLGGWLDVRQAIALQGIVGNAKVPQTPLRVAVPRVDKRVLRARFEQVQQALKQSILTGAAPAPGMPRIDMPDTDLKAPIDPRTAFDTWRRYLTGQQRQMESVLRGLRQQLRSMLESAGEAHQLLAALDALFENVLLERESRLLAQISAVFEKRFTLALREHLVEQEQAAENDTPAPCSQNRLQTVADDLRAALLAELDLRLQPVLGLIEALTPDTPPEQ